MTFLLHLFLFLMHLGQLANCFNDNVVSRDNQAVPQVQNNSIATVTVLLHTCVKCYLAKLHLDWSFDLYTTHASKH